MRCGRWSRSIHRRVKTGAAPAGSWIHVDPGPGLEPAENLVKPVDKIANLTEVY